MNVAMRRECARFAVAVECHVPSGRPPSLEALPERFVVDLDPGVVVRVEAQREQVTLGRFGAPELVAVAVALDRVLLAPWELRPDGQRHRDTPIVPAGQSLMSSTTPLACSPSRTTFLTPGRRFLSSMRGIYRRSAKMLSRR